MNGQQVYIAKDESYPAVVSQYTDGSQKHFTTWMQESLQTKSGVLRSVRVVPPLQLANGDRVSIQASDFHYCTPRTNQQYSLYESFELLHCSGEFPKELEQYFDGTVCCNVPMTTIERVIYNAGGIVGLTLQKVSN
jgi:hypothetical protein